MDGTRLTLSSIFADVKGGGGELDRVVQEGAVDLFALAELSRRPPPSDASTKARPHWAVMEEAMADVDARFQEEVKEPAREYAYELDGFQKRAILHLERGENVFVSAHTSAGKTAVAEYALAMATRNRTKAIYTSPIKTISNQKFRDFQEEGYEVGLLTGDVSIRPDAPCLIMTTEILRSMLYRGADVIRDVEWVIFDEVHYVNDIDRGVVWEEVIIMLPRQVNMIMLSATVPNTFEFADWIGRTKQRSVYVTGTQKRPVPLEHLLYYAGDLFKICEHEQFLPEGYRQAKAAYKEKNDPMPVPVAPRGKGQPQPPQTTGNRGRGGRPAGQRGRGQQQQQQGARGRGPKPTQAARQPHRGNPMRSERNELVKLIGMLKKKELLPAVFFVFSKKKCEGCAEKLESMDLSTGAEKVEIHQFFDRCMSRLNEEDRKLPQLVRMKDMLKRGMAVHHAGLLPIVKEVVEILFCRGLIKVLFSTETFAMGVNAPARVCVFHSLEKHDGREFRTLLSGEYTQMAGRAGRRGIDPVGTVIIMCWDEIPMESTLKHLLTGKATKLQSQFRLRYNMILNVFRVDDMKMEDMLKRSFAELSSQRSLPYAKVLLEKGEQSLRQLEKKPWPDCYLKCTRDDIRTYWRLRKRSDDLHKYLQDYLMASSAAQHALGPGRVVVLKRRGRTMWEPAVLLASDFTGTRTAMSTASMHNSKQKGQLIALVLLSGALEAEPGSSGDGKVEEDVSQAADEFAGFGAPLGQALIGKYKESLPSKPDFASMSRGLPKYGEIDDLRGCRGHLGREGCKLPVFRTAGATRVGRDLRGRYRGAGSRAGLEDARAGVRGGVRGEGEAAAGHHRAPQPSLSPFGGPAVSGGGVRALGREAGEAALPPVGRELAAGSGVQAAHAGAAHLALHRRGGGGPAQGSGGLRDQHGGRAGVHRADPAGRVVPVVSGGGGGPPVRPGVPGEVRAGVRAAPRAPMRPGSVHEHRAGDRMAAEGRGHAGPARRSRVPVLELRIGGSGARLGHGRTVRTHLRTHGCDGRCDRAHGGAPGRDLQGVRQRGQDPRRRRAGGEDGSCVPSHQAGRGLRRLPVRAMKAVLASSSWNARSKDVLEA
eukprot:scaffold1501_cov352-Pavlova_lutheri.AAC.48